MAVTTRTLSGMLMLAAAVGLAGCDSDHGPLAPSPNPPSTPQPQPGQPPQPLVFYDGATGFSTSDLRDAQDQIVRITNVGELIWVADDTRLPGYWVTQGIYISCSPCGGALEIRFSGQNGERRAYLTVDYGHDNPGSLIDLEVAGGALVARRTSVFPPGTYTLSGVVTEATPAGSVPLADVKVYRGYATGWIEATTDRHGFYEIHGLYDREDVVVAKKEGYETRKSQVAIGGDTRFDIELVRP